MRLDLALDFFPLAAATLAAATCGLLGSFLLLRRMSLMGDAISHSVLPGLVIAFLVTGTRSPLAMFGGAAIAGLATVLLVEAIRRHGRVEPGAAMGVVFSLFFALGVLLIEQASARQVDLDPDCVLHGQLETLVWYGAPRGWSELFAWETLAAAPATLWTLVGVGLASAVFVAILFKELRLVAFDPALATAQGFSAGLLHALLMAFVAAATVASFEAVGSILVVAMLVCPAATARMLTDRLSTQVWLSVAIAIASAWIGYIAATAVPAAFGFDSVNAAGSIAVVTGAMLAIAAVAGPEHGLVARAVRRRRFAQSIACEDLLAALYRARESGRAEVPIESASALLAPARATDAIRRAEHRGWIARRADRLALTDAGLAESAALVRRHRLWETYLVEEAGLAPDHVHDTAEKLEHAPIEIDLDAATDPQGKRIPRGE
ncbi:MAG: metal ABC transporter permease [Phycisphaerales bacterium]